MKCARHCEADIAPAKSTPSHIVPAGAVLRGRLWFFLCLAQPINAGVFVYDGLMYATQSFACARTVMLTGFLFAFAPLLALTEWRLHALWGVWGAKAAHNIWRLLGSVLRVHVLFEREAAAALG